MSGLYVGIDPDGPNAGDTYRNKHNRQDWLVFSRTIHGVVTLLSPDKQSKADYSIQALEIDFERIEPRRVVADVSVTALAAHFPGIGGLTVSCGCGWDHRFDSKTDGEERCPEDDALIVRSNDWAQRAWARHVLELGAL